MRWRGERDELGASLRIRMTRPRSSFYVLGQASRYCGCTQSHHLHRISTLQLRSSRARPALATSNRSAAGGRACGVIGGQGIRVRGDAGRRARELVRSYFVGGFSGYQRVAMPPAVIGDFTPWSSGLHRRGVRASRHQHSSVAVEIPRRSTPRETEIGLPISIGVARTHAPGKNRLASGQPDGLFRRPADGTRILTICRWSDVGRGAATKARRPRRGSHIGQLAPPSPRR